jgi:Holliday junction resolvase
MPNPNYIKGRRKEYKIRRELIDEGFDIVQRSAGSHSPIDVFAINKATNEILLVQAKPKGFTSKEYEQYNWLNNEFKVRFEIR